MWFAILLAVVGLGCGCLGAVLGLCVGIEEQKRRERLNKAERVPEALVATADKTLARLGVVRLD